MLDNLEEWPRQQLEQVLLEHSFTIDDLNHKLMELQSFVEEIVERLEVLLRD